MFSSTSTDLFSYWIQREKLFFKYRLDYILPRQLHRLFRNIIKHVTEDYEQDSEIDQVVIKFCTLFLKSNVFHHIVDPKHPDDCFQYQLEGNHQRLLLWIEKQLLKNLLFKINETVKVN